MQGWGTIAEGSTAHSGGIVHMAANDIFQHIQANPDRMFLVRASFLEIYNEEVRDLLSSEQKVLQIREDPRRGVFVQSQEEYVTDYASLLQVLFTGEKSRAFAATAMNERSSRSHTIFRITIESREKSVEGEHDDNDEDDDMDSSKPDGAVRVSTLNLVDLAGSESVRHTGATGDRQKEGGMINQSLLTLSRVIVALGQPNQTHINFRDSKLTRILQPSLSGNARMAVICCATPSELYLEETRSTLQFASRAKLVKTNAQVNEVLDDRSMIRRLQKELAQARAEAGGVPSAKVKALEEKAANAGSAARKAHEKLQKLQASILNNEGLFASTDTMASKNIDAANRKRRRSDGALQLTTQEDAATHGATPKTLPRPEKKKRLADKTLIRSSQELELLREALLVKSQQLTGLRNEISEIQITVQAKEARLAEVSNENETLESEKEEIQSTVADLTKQISDLRDVLSTREAAYEAAIGEKDTTYQQILARLDQELKDRKVLEETLDDLQDDKVKLEEDKMAAINQNEQLAKRVADLEPQMVEATEENKRLADIEVKNQEELQSLREQLDLVSSELDKARDTNECLKKDVAEWRQRSESKDAQIAAIQQSLDSEKKAHQDTEARAQSEINKTREELLEYRQQSDLEKATLSESVAQLSKTVEALEVDKQDFSDKLAEVSTYLGQEKEQKSDLENRVEALRDELSSTERGFSVLVALASVRMEQLQRNATTMESILKQEVLNTQKVLESTKSELVVAMNETRVTTEQVDTLQVQLVDRQAEIDSLNEQLTLSKQQCDTYKNEKVELERGHEQAGKQMDEITCEKERLQDELLQCQKSISDLESRIQEQHSEGTQKQSKLVELEENIKTLHSTIKTMEEAAQNLEASKATLEIENEALKSDNSSIRQQTENLNTELEAKSKTIEDLMANFASISTRFSVMKEESESLRRDTEHLQSRYVEVKNELDESNIKRDQLYKLNESQTVEIDKLRLQLESVLKEVQSKESYLEEMEKTILELQGRSESSSATVQGLQNNLKQKEEEITSIQEALIDAQKRVAILEKAREIALVRLQLLESGEGTAREHLEAALAEAQTAKEEMSLLQSEFSEVKTRIQTLESENKKISDNLEKCLSANRLLEEERCNMSSRLENISTELSTTQSERETLVQENLKLSETYYEEREKSLDLEKRVEKLNEEITKSKSDLEKLKQTVEVTDSKNGMLTSEIASLQAERDTMRDRMDEINKMVSDIEASRDASLDREKDIRAEMEAASAAFMSEKSTFESTISSLESERARLEREIEEIKQESSNRADELIQAHDLVEAANESTQKLKAELRDLEDTLAAKDEMLSQAYDALEKEKHRAAEETSNLTNQIKELRAEIELSKSKKVSTEETNSLQEENDELKGLLASANESVKEMEEERDDALGKLIYAEQQYQALLQSQQSRSQDNTKVAPNTEELQSEVTRLQELLDQNKKVYIEKEEKLKSSFEEERRMLINDAEAEMASIRKEKDDLVAKLQATESEAYAARKTAEDMRDEVKQHIDKTIQIESRLAALENENSRLKRSAARHEDDRASETSALKMELKKAREETAISRDEQHSLELRLGVYEKRLREKENEVNQVLKNMHDLNVPKMEQEINDLRAQLFDATNRLKEQNTSSQSLEKLSEEVKQLKAQIVTKDERILRLDKSKLTKDKVAALKKMKQENKETKEENEFLKDKLRVAEQTLKEISSSGDKGHSAEITKLKFDKDAIESKLRKYATHCQRLEEERDSVREVLRSKKINSADTTSSIADVVVTLVDHLTSLEEKCDSLSRSETQIASVLEEIESLRKQNRTLQSQAAEARRNSNQTSHTESELNESIRHLRQQVEKTQNELREAQLLTSDIEQKNKRAIQRLEHENLQIMRDLKAKKDELAKCKAELNSARLRSTYSTRDKVTVASSLQSKENMDNRDQEGASRPPLGSAKKTSLSSTVKAPLASARKALRRRHEVPGLGEALEENHENTQECKQS
jgi:centromeric protein E